MLTHTHMHTRLVHPCAEATSRWSEVIPDSVAFAADMQLMKGSDMEVVQRAGESPLAAWLQLSSTGPAHRTPVASRQRRLRYMGAPQRR